MSLRAQITRLVDYSNNASAPIGVHQSISIREGGFSGLTYIPGTNGKEFWVVSDRGLNVDCANANSSSCRPQYDKMYSFPSYGPKIFRIRLHGDSAQILRTIPIRRPDGTPATGLLLPTGLGSLATEIASRDTVLNCADYASKIVGKDPWGIDSEGILVDLEGNFWICEEGGPSIWKLSPDGIVLQRFTPWAGLTGAQPQDVPIDTVFRYRKNNRGFESICMSPNGKIYVAIQSPLLYPNKSIGEGTRVHRILEITPSTGAMRMLAYLNDGIIGSSGSNQIRLRDWKLGDMVAINDSTFLVLEAALRGTSDFRRMYLININRATAVHSGLYNGVTLEALIDSAGLAANGIVPVSKTLFMDLLANQWPAVYEKAEGLAIINDSTIAIGNDNDYGAISPLENGIAIPTGIACHVLTYRLQGANKIPFYRPLPYRITLTTGPSSTQTPYLTPTTSGVRLTSVLSVADSAANGYHAAGYMDGTGAFDNNDGTFTFLIGHEIVAGLGAVRAHGQNGAFISRWVIDKSSLAVRSGSDLIRNVNIWTGTGYTTYNASNPSPLAQFSRFCSADLPPPVAFFNAVTGMGTQERLFMNGEEVGENGRSFAHVVTGANAGTTYQLPLFGRYSVENQVARPVRSDKTVVVGLDDSSPGQVYVYIGTKTNTGTEIDRAGLTNGKLYGVAVAGLPVEQNTTIPSPNTAFTLVDLGNVRDSSGAAINAMSTARGVTNFLRPEDGAWDPANPRDFYFVTTNSITTPSRMWRLRFNDVNMPESGGTITAVLDGTEGPRMMDNLTIDATGDILIQEDPGNNVHNAKIWQYTIATDSLKLLAQHDTTRFILGGSQYLTQDEESSGIIDVQSILGPGMFLFVDQAHYPIAGAAVEGGQILAMFNPDSYNGTLGAGPTSSQSPYLTPVAPGVKMNSIITVPDAVGGYQSAGYMDGTGAFDNNDGTFTFLIGHEISAGLGAVRAHGQNGAFISRWVIDKSSLAVRSGSDLIRNVNIWNGRGYTTYNTQNPSTLAQFSRFCSADLPPTLALYCTSSGKGTTERIFFTGEEVGENGRGFAHIVTGPNAGTSYQLPLLGRYSFENIVTQPINRDKTVVIGLDDSSPGQVYVYIGTKTESGSEIDKAGLTNGQLYGVAVAGLPVEQTSSIPSPNSAFTLINLGNVRDSSGAAINAMSVARGVTNFLRPEDGAWDPSNPRDFYFVTTNTISTPSRLWRLRFHNADLPEDGGTITAVLDGTEGPRMMDNLTIDSRGNILIQEDPGNNVHNAKIWQYTIATDSLKLLAQHDTTRFILSGSQYLTQDEESSGIIDVQSILGPGMFLFVDQAHYPIAGAAVEGGQILTMFNPGSYNSTLGAGPSSSQDPFLTPMEKGVTFNAIVSVPDAAGGIRMAGIPDGAGAFDNNDGTFTMLVGHEIAAGLGVPRAHGQNGAFVSRWVIDKATLAVRSGSDLIKNVNIWNGASYTTYNTANPSPLAVFSRFCSADLPVQSALFNASTGRGTIERLFMNGEESGENGRCFAHIASGANNGTSYELPALGKYSVENIVACPVASDKTVVVGLDDASPGQIYVYIGTKTSNGTEIDKAGLTNGKLYGVAVSGMSIETSTAVPTANTSFTLVDLGNVRDSSGAALNTMSNARGVTNFLRPEDGSWDPANPQDFYFVTTNSFTAPSRMWRLRFTDITKPENGGTITAVLRGTEGPKMMDNITLDTYGHVLIQEDVGNNAHNGKIWEYTIATGALKLLAQHDTTRFVLGGSRYLTQDEESSGIIDAQSIFGPGYFLLVDQAHYPIAGEAVEGGQLLRMFSASTFASSAEISVRANNIEILNNQTAISTLNNTDFGTVNFPGSSKRTFVVYNGNGAELVISRIDFAGTNGVDFSVAGNPVFPMRIPANGFREITVQFTPTGVGTREATVTMASNDFDESVFRFNVRGVAVYKRIVVRGNNRIIPEDLSSATTDNNTDFGTVFIGSQLQRVFTVTNSGSSDLLVSSITVRGSSAKTFVVAGNSAQAVTPGSSMKFTVSYSPESERIDNAEIVIESDDPLTPQFVFPVQGMGKLAIPNVVLQGNGITIANGDVTPDAADNTEFGTVRVGGLKSGRFSISNSGTATLTLSQLSITGANASDFSLFDAPKVPDTIIPGGRRDLNIRFAPKASGVRLARVSLQTNSKDNAGYEFAIRGTGEEVINAVDDEFQGIALVPNPADQMVRIQSTEGFADVRSISVIDANGVSVFSMTIPVGVSGDYTPQFSTQTMTSGVYYVVLERTTTRTMVKMTVVH